MAIRKAETTHPNSLENTFGRSAAAEGKDTAEDDACIENEKILCRHTALVLQACETDD